MTMKLAMYNLSRNLWRMANHQLKLAQKQGDADALELAEEHYRVATKIYSKAHKMYHGTN